MTHRFWCKTCRKPESEVRGPRENGKGEEINKGSAAHSKETPESEGNMNGNEDSAESPLVSIMQEMRMMNKKLDSNHNVLTEIRNDIRDIKNRVSKVEEKSRQLETDVHELKTKINDTDDIRKSVEFINNQYDEINKELKKSNGTFDGINAQANEIEEIKQYERINNMIIYGIPDSTSREYEEEDVYKYVKNIAEALNIPHAMSKNEIDVAHRLPSRIKKTGPTMIIVKFRNRWVKDEFMKARAVKKSLHLSEIGFPDNDKQVYLRDHLTPQNDTLFKKCRELRQGGKIWATWTRDCKIYIKINQDDKKTFRISNEEDLRKLRSKIQQ